MKYHLDVSLPAAWDLNTAHDYTYDHLSVIDHIHNYQEKGSERIEDSSIIRDEKVYYWIDLSTIPIEYPFMTNQSLMAISRYLTKLEKDKLIETIHGEKFRRFARLTEKGYKLYFRVNSKS